MSVLRQMLRPSKLLKRRALYQGLLGGSRGWLSVGMVMWVWGFLKRFFAGGDPLTRYMEELQPGERLVITHPEPALSRRKARKARKRDKASANEQASVKQANSRKNAKANKQANSRKQTKAAAAAAIKEDKSTTVTKGGRRRMRVRRG